MEKKYPPDSHMKDYQTSVGRIALTWAMFEMHVNRGIWELANVEQHVGACITAQIFAPGPRFRALVALIAFRGGTPGHIRKFNQMVARAEGLANSRNRFVHDPAFQRHSDGALCRWEVTADKKLKFGAQPVTMEDFRDLENKIRGITRDFYKLFRETIDALPPFPNIQFGQSQGIQITLPEDRDI